MIFWGQQRHIDLKAALWQALVFLCLLAPNLGWAAYQEFNSTGGTSATNGLHIYVDDSTQLQVRRLNNTGQLYAPGALPPSTSLDNGIFLRANGRVYGPDHNVTTFAPTGGMYNNYTLSPVSPTNPTSSGVQQTMTANFGVTLGPQVTVVWKYTTPLDFVTAEVTVVIPALYAVSNTNPVRYYHVVDTYLGGSDNGCGVRFTDANGKFVVGTYPPVSGSTCPSSTSIPTGVTILESFRERSGLSFSNYCANSWSSFWVNGGVNCSILQSGNMSNAISTAFQDTGIGIQYNFTAPGTYQFSYDFVVGSPSVPPYDHLEIQHPGTTSLCPANLTVLACISSAVPCPANSVIATGTLTGNLTYSPTGPALTVTPATFTLGNNGSTATVSVQGSGARTYTLGSANLSTPPLNGTKCWNTANNTASCSFTVNNTPCVSGFECIEPGLSYNNLNTNPSARNPLYTEVAGAGFQLDVVALESSGAQASSYVASSNVIVELFDDDVTPQPACSAYSSPIASQSITFTGADAGRKTTPSLFNISNAYRKVRCRVRDTNLSVLGCSSDTFAVRPANFTLISNNANADNAGLSATASPRIKAGSAFSLTATASAMGYDGVPQVDSTKLEAHTGAVQAGTLNGAFGTANPNTSAASGASFNYSEVGYFRLAANGVYDDTFTAIDTANGDCAIGFNASGAKNACSFGNVVASNYFGRFYPDHFDIETGTSTPSCGSQFSYFGQDGLTTTFTLVAKNTANATVQNYAGSFAKLGLNIWANYQFSANPLPAGAVLSASTTAPSGGWNAGRALISAKHQISRPTVASAPSNITIRANPTDSDGVTLPSTAVSTASEFRFGRLFVSNSYGSELLALNIPIEAQYWNGTAYLRNRLDTCSVVLPSNIGMSNYKGLLNACDTQISSSGALVDGKTTARLSAPGSGNQGSVDIDVNLNNAAGSTTCVGSAASNATSSAMPWFGNVDPAAKATFGIFKSPVIYLRENYY